MDVKFIDDWCEYWCCCVVMYDIRDVRRYEFVYWIFGLDWSLWKRWFLFEIDWRCIVGCWIDWVD